MSKKIYGIPVTTPFNPDKIAGAYYTPSFTQVDETTMRVSFVASKPGMPEIPDQVITLPHGLKGDKGDTPVKGTDYFTNAEVDAIVAQAASNVTLDGIGAIGYKRVLTADDDCDALLEDGVYFYTTSTVTPDKDGKYLKNAPFENAAVIMVFGAKSNTSQKIQIAFRYAATGHFKSRSLYSGKWLAWTQYATTDSVAEVMDAVTAVQAGAVSNAAAIDISNQDLVSALGGKSGFYRGNKVTNAPTADAWYYFWVSGGLTNTLAIAQARDSADFYFATFAHTATSVNWTKVANADDVTAKQIGATQMKILWTNESPSSSFAAQTILNNGELTGCNVVIILFHYDIDNARKLPAFICNVGASNGGYASGINPSSKNIVGRVVQSVKTDTGIVFAGGYNNGSSDNKACIPYRVYGIDY